MYAAAATALTVSKQFGYYSIPTDSLRNYVDGLFPYLAKCSIADSVAQGGGHRFKGGHDLLLDIPTTFGDHGLVDAVHHAGHILLTDFPTKAGIPIPGFSQSGLGSWLQTIGIERGWLSLNICDAGVGVLAVAESSPDLLNALDGSLTMGPWTFFDTFVEGGAELLIGFGTENPLLLIAGVQNVLAGLGATYNTLSVYVDPFTVLGSSMVSAILGFIVGQSLGSGDLSSALASALRAGCVGGLFAISPSFGFAAISGLLMHALGKSFATTPDKRIKNVFKIDRNSIKLLVDEICRVRPEIDGILKASKSNLIILPPSSLPCGEVGTFDSKTDSFLGIDQIQRGSSSLNNTFDVNRLKTIFSAPDILPTNASSTLNYNVEPRIGDYLKPFKTKALCDGQQVKTLDSDINELSKYYEAFITD